MIAGFEQPTHGQIFVMGQQVAGIPAHLRPVNTVFQNYALFPHMNAVENVAFGLEMAKIPKDQIRKRAVEALELVQMEEYAHRKPGQLSGGQRQRVALARALVNRPKVLLLDEPLGALDLKLRKAMQLELKQIQAEVGITFIYVTHDQEEALTMSDRIGVVHRGQIKQVGFPNEIYEHPENKFVADFIGETNFIDGVVVSNNGVSALDAKGVTIKGAAGKKMLKQGQNVTLAIRPEKVRLYAAGAAKPNDDDQNVVIKARVIEAIYIGTDTRYRIELDNKNCLFVREQNQGFGQENDFEVGDEIFIHWLSQNAQILVD
jgi:spermidine/putrescine transport system ATP-binding protein